MAYGYFKDLNTRTAADKLLRNKALNIAKNWKYDEYQHGPASMVYKFFNRTASGSGIKNKNIEKKQLAEELNNPVIRKLNKRKVPPLPFIDNIWGVDLADMQLISKFNIGFRYLLCLCAIDINSKYAWVISLTDKKGITVTNLFQNILDESKRKPNKIWFDKGSEIF